ncbi:hypothetical protein BH11MYX4_BH11MYX4_46010 [soil metagenome]
MRRTVVASRVVASHRPVERAVTVGASEETLEVVHSFS